MAFLLVGLIVNSIFEFSVIGKEYAVFFFLMFFVQALSGIILAYIRGVDKITELSISSIAASVVTIGCKKYSWHSYYMHIYYANNEYIKSRKIDPFLKLFSMGVLNQKECFTCPMRNESAADIRLGDFWGKRYANSEEGYSMVLLLTDKGKRYFDSLHDVERDNLPIEERFGQQHTDYTIPEKYEEGFSLLLNNTKLERIINLYDPPVKRLFREVKGVAKSLLKK